MYHLGGSAKEKSHSVLLMLNFSLFVSWRQELFISFWHHIINWNSQRALKFFFVVLFLHFEVLGCLLGFELGFEGLLGFRQIEEKCSKKDWKIQQIEVCK